MTHKRLCAIALVLIVAALILGPLANPGAQPAQADGGAYSILFAAADPEMYIPPIPFPSLVTPIVGRGNGDAQIPRAWYNDPNTLTNVRVESLNPYSMALCQVVPFEIRIEVGDADPEDEPITFVAGWHIDTTNNDNFGYDPAYEVYAAFVDTGDGAHHDPGEDATVSYTSTVVGDEIQGTFTVYGLDDNDVVVVEVWMVLDCTLPDKVGGNVQSRLISGTTHAGDAINTGNQTVPLLQVGSFTTADVDLQVVKYDDNLWKAVNEPFQYTLTVSNLVADTVSNQVVVEDTLDPWLQYLSVDSISPAYERTCTWADDDTDGLGGTVTCELGAVPADEPVTIIFSVKAVPGVPLGSLCEGASESNPASSCSSECSPTSLSPTGYDVCNAVSVSTISDDTNPDNNWDQEPKDIKYPTPVDLVSFTATGLPGAIQLDWETSSEVDNAGFNLYRGPSLNGKRTQLNATLIPTLQPPGSLDGAVYQWIDTTMPGKGTYYYWLEDVDILGYTELHGPVSSQVEK